MKISRLTNFLSFPAQNIDFDKFLIEHEITERPLDKPTPIAWLNRKDLGVSMIFYPVRDYRKWWGLVGEDGEMIFSTLQIYGENNDSGFAGYRDQLPYGLTFASTLQEARAIFGEPTLDHLSGPENRVYLWYGYQGYSIALCFLPENNGISFLSIEKNKKNPPKKK
ncbi:hypothetical protein PO883_33635 [Massilia sp. DJPM01]|uniref:hypothetical protein n=1 Tax=Massilia sp. DJPM01 TaxID=3024404 RepID=UPI00259DED49|nr:hypothetical protein [Massilia sp. DJPM01]MDM5182115.1 hypothetical protein [Massilia sp. DJPM01]